MAGIFTKIQKKELGRYLESIDFKGGNVLDVGCGRGQYAKIFGEGYVGIDKDPESIINARKENDGLRFEVMDATKLDFPDKSFDLIFSIAVFHHLNDNDISKALQEIFRVAKDNSHILLIDVVLPRSLKFLAYPIFWIDKGAIIRSFERFQEIVSNITSPRFKKLNRFLSIGVATFEWKK